ncbi:hypothetical protein [Actinomadura sp. NEAU-AAG7]|uniref:hypothetical protein n=1 Tax=Actinomadura sp. NEAU-AAG7 TaxID=2839640 RepID=UPI001BE3F14C|nr:hypothetical protein [Actinomadura sp. NEAU-AAG7]MBT2214156.1 hypothetical protein [Actinomadura sp. NEAU-AAG7]
MPGALVPTVWYDGEGDPPPKPPDPGDTALRWTVWEPGQSGWSEDRVIPGHKSLLAPALATDRNGSFYCVHRGDKGDEKLYLTVYHDGKWTLDSQLPADCTTSYPPAVTWHPTLGVIVVFVKAGKQCWTARSGHGTGGNWSTPKEIPDLCRGIPAVAVAGNRLVCVSVNDYSDLCSPYWSEADLAKGHNLTWSKPQRIPSQVSCGSGVSMAVDASNLITLADASAGGHCITGFHLAPGKTTWGWACTGNNNATHSTDHTPAIGYVSTDNNTGHELLLVYRSDDSSKKDKLMWATTYAPGGLKHRQKFPAGTEMPGHDSATAPAVVYGSYTGEDGKTKAQAMCVHRGKSA